MEIPCARLRVKFSSSTAVEKSIFHCLAKQLKICTKPNFVFNLTLTIWNLVLGIWAPTMVLFTTSSTTKNVGDKPRWGALLLPGIRSHRQAGALQVASVSGIARLGRISQDFAGFFLYLWNVSFLHYIADLSKTKVCLHWKGVRWRHSFPQNR